MKIISSVLGCCYHRFGSIRQRIEGYETHSSLDVFRAASLLVTNAFVNGHVTTSVGFCRKVGGERSRTGLGR